MVAAGQALGVDDVSLTAILGAVLAALAGAVAAYFKGARAGRNAAKVEQVQHDDKTRREFDRIDRRAPDLGDALARLRKRASVDGQPPAK